MGGAKLVLVACIKVVVVAKVVAVGDEEGEVRVCPVQGGWQSSCQATNVNNYHIK